MIVVMAQVERYVDRSETTHFVGAFSTAKLAAGACREFDRRHDGRVSFIAQDGVKVDNVGHWGVSPYYLEIP